MTVGAFAQLTDKAAALGLLVLALALVAAGRWWGRATAPVPDTAPPDTVTRTRQLVKRDTVTETVPETVIRYDTVRSTDTVRIAVPDSARIKGVIEPSPLDLTEGEATLTYYDPTAGRYMQDVYDIPDTTPLVTLAPDLGTTAMPTTLSTHAARTATLPSVAGGLTLEGGAAVSTSSLQTTRPIRPYVGASLSLFSIDLGQ